MQPDYQKEVMRWGDECFGGVINRNEVQRNHRFMEEALELVQSCNMTKEEVLEMVEYVFNRDIGEKEQEVGGVLVSLAALCEVQDIDMMHAGQVELDRVWTKIPEIKAKQLTKPKHSGL